MNYFFYKTQKVDLPATKIKPFILSGGFTVVEMIVVISIFSILGGMLMFNYKGFQKNQDFSVFAQEVGLLIKEQQQNAMAGVFPAIDPDDKQYPALDWKPSYGVYIHPTAPGQDSFIVKFYDVFVDQAYNKSGPWDASSCSVFDNECLSLLTVGNGREIFAIYEGGTQIQNLSIVFTRPYPDAHMYRDYTDFTFPTTAIPVVDTVEIFFKDPGVEGYNVVSINPTGAISIRREQ